MLIEVWIWGWFICRNIEDLLVAFPIEERSVPPSATINYL